MLGDSHLERYLTGSLPEGISPYTAMEKWIYAICLIKYVEYVKYVAIIFVH